MHLYRHLTPEQRIAARYIPQGYTEKIESGNGVIYHTPDKLHAIAYHGKAARHDWHYSFRKPEDFDVETKKFFEGLAHHKEIIRGWRTKRKAEHAGTIQSLWEKARINCNEGGYYMSTAETALLIRERLKREFPGTKFSVCSKVYSGGSSVSVGWTDGPAQRDVEKITDPYEGAGFDGMIDLKYHVTRWLYADGTVSMAHNHGTDGSRGAVQEDLADPIKPDGVMVRGGADYVTCSQTLSETRRKELLDGYRAYLNWRGWEWSEANGYLKLSNLDAESLDSIAWRLSQGIDPFFKNDLDQEQREICGIQKTSQLEKDTH